MLIIGNTLPVGLDSISRSCDPAQSIFSAIAAYTINCCHMTFQLQMFLSSASYYVIMALWSRLDDHFMYTYWQIWWSFAEIAALDKIPCSFLLNLQESEFML